MMGLAKAVGITNRHLCDIRSGRRRPSVDLALELEKATGINRLAWLYPQEFFNPDMPFRYRHVWPPDLKHLEGDSLKLAKQIISAFPHRPPTREEFRAWKRAMRKKAKKNGGSHD